MVTQVGGNNAAIPFMSKRTFFVSELTNGIAKSLCAGIFQPCFNEAPICNATYELLTRADA
jgi:hypothetical protein